MDDREKVIKGLEEISDYFFSVYHHSKDREEINKAKDRCDAVEDALALLKEQEDMVPIHAVADWLAWYAVPPNNANLSHDKMTAAWVKFLEQFKE